MTTKKAKRPRHLFGITYEEVSGCGKIYITINQDFEGNAVEVFVRLGKAGGCGAATMEGVGRLISTALRSGSDPRDIMKTVKGIQCHRTGSSCLDCVGRILEEHLGPEE